MIEPNTEFITSQVQLAALATKSLTSILIHAYVFLSSSFLTNFNAFALEEDGQIKVGFKDESERKEILVESLDIILQNDTKGETGLICRSIDSMALYWLPITDAAWTNLFRIVG